MKKILVLTVFFGAQVFAQEQVNCTANSVPIKMAGFSGYGAELKKTKQIAQLVKPSEDQVSTFEKSFEIGKYRFVRNDKNWDIYRKNENGQFEKKNISGKFQVDADQKIWATLRDDGSINIHRNVAGDEYQKEFNVFFKKSDIVIQDSDRNSILNYTNCKNEKTNMVKSAPANLPTNSPASKGQK